MNLDRTITDANGFRAARVSQSLPGDRIRVAFGFPDGDGYLRLSHGQPPRDYATEAGANAAAAKWIGS